MKKRLHIEYYIIYMIIADKMLDTRQKVIFYRTRNLYLDGQRIEEREVDEITDCLGKCVKFILPSNLLSNRLPSIRKKVI